MTYLLIRTAGGWHEPEERSVVATFRDREDAEVEAKRRARLWSVQ